MEEPHGEICEADLCYVKCGKKFKKESYGQ